jgi:hypothetical protein
MTALHNICANSLKVMGKNLKLTPFAGISKYVLKMKPSGIQLLAKKGGLDAGYQR